MMTTKASSPAERSAGTVLAAVAGDALGWPQELKGGLVGGRRAREDRVPEARFTDWNRNSGNRFTGRYVDPVRAGEYSDDSQLLFSVARSCLAGEQWLSHFTDAELPTWHIYQRGGGSAVLAAASSWANGRAPWAPSRSERERNRTTRYLNAGANGVAMRIAPHVLYLLGEPDAVERRDRLLTRVLADGVTTHGHPRALVGALAYAAALDFAVNAADTIEYGALVGGARQGLIASSRACELLPEGWPAIQKLGAFQSLWDETCAEMEALLDRVQASLELGALSSTQETLKGLGVTNPKIGGAGTITSAAAIYLASRSAPKPMSALVSAAYQPEADTDTLASMVGGLLGGMHGTGWLRELEPMQDQDYAVDLGARLVSKRGISRYPDVRLLKERSEALLEHLDAGDSRSGGVFPDGRKYTVESIHQLDRQGYKRFRLRLEDNQTVIIDRKSVAAADLSVSTELAGEGRRSSADGNADPESPSMRSVGRSAAPPLSVFVTLPTAEVHRIADFYSRLIGHQLTVREGNLRLSPHVLFLQAKGELESHNISAALDLQVKDIAAAAEVLGESIRGTGVNRHVIGKDPEGRPVRVHQWL